MELPPPFREQDGQIAIDLPGARAIFTTRSWGDARETWREIGARLGVTIVAGKQAHGTEVMSILSTTGHFFPSDREADAVITPTSGIAPMVLTADCLPIVIASPRAVAVVHAGWRGLAAGIIGGAVTALRELSAGVMHAAIGPGAGACCYGVGEELHRRFKARSQDFHRGRNLDLKAIARVQLMESGVASIHDAGLCTICGDAARLFSHRREGSLAGRHAAVAWLT